MSTTAVTPKSQTSSKAISHPRGRKVTPKSTEVAATPQVPAGKATKAAKVRLADLFATHAPNAEHAEHLAALCGMPDDLAFRRAVTHYAQGKRVLSPYRATLIREGDPAVYVEKHGKKAAN